MIILEIEIKLKMWLSPACSPSAVRGSKEASAEHGVTWIERSGSWVTGFELFPPWPSKLHTVNHSGRSWAVKWGCTAHWSVLRVSGCYHLPYGSGCVCICSSKSQFHHMWNVGAVQAGKSTGWNAVCLTPVGDLQLSELRLICPLITKCWVWTSIFSEF